MRITKRQLRRIIREACGIEAAPAVPVQIEQADIGRPNVPLPADYNAVRDLLSQNPDLVDMGVSLVMQMAGTSCQRSTVQAVIDHLQDMLDAAPGEEEFSFTGDVGALPGDEAFGIGYEAGMRGLE